MKISAQIIYSLFAPSYCEKRMYFTYNRVKALEPGPFEQLIFKLGLRHEENYLNSITGYRDISFGKMEDRIELTRQYINNKVPIIYQGVLSENLRIDNKEITLTGIPDFLIWEENGYRIRDCKLARHVDEKKHQEIIIQLKIYILF